jgi:hypothetical protein
MAVATTEKSLNIEPPKRAIPEKRGISAIPFLDPNNARSKPAKMARATPGIFFLNNFSDIKNDKYMIIPTTKKAKTNPFLSINLYTSSIYF